MWEAMKRRSSSNTQRQSAKFIGDVYNCSGSNFYSIVENNVLGQVSDTYRNARENPNIMKDAFSRIATSEKKFVEVWQVFENAEKEMRSGKRDPADKYQILAKIHSKLFGGLA